MCSFSLGFRHLCQIVRGGMAEIRPAPNLGAGHVGSICFQTGGAEILQVRSE